VAVTGKSNDGPHQSALGKENSVQVVKNKQSKSTEDSEFPEEESRTLESSFKHLWNDYSVDWKDTRRYPGDGAAVLQHRKLCMSNLTAHCLFCLLVRVSNPDMGVNLDPNDKVFFFADSGNPGGPN